MLVTLVGVGQSSMALIFFRVHSYPILGDDVTQVLYLCFIKITFTKPGVELVFS